MQVSLMLSTVAACSLTLLPTQVQSVSQSAMSPKHLGSQPQTLQPFTYSLVLGKHSDRTKGNAPVAAVIVYGRPECGLTSRMRRDLDARGIPYQFQNIDDQAVRREMWTLLSTAKINVGSSVRLPVLRVGTQVLVNATIAEVERAYSR